MPNAWTYNGGTTYSGAFSEDALEEHLDDATDAHAASAISFSPTGTVAASNVQAAIAEVASEGGGGGGGGAPSGPAGGVLSGTYPDPGFAADMATQAELDAVAAAKQPLDSDLTAIAALSTTSFGRSLLEAANAGAARTLIDAAAASHDHDGTYQPLDSDLTAIAALSTTSFGRSLLEQADAATARSTLAIANPQPSYKTGEYYAYRGTLSGAGSGAPVQSTVYYLPFVVFKTQSFDRIATYISANGSSGAVDRLGIFQDNGSGQPGTLVVDAGTVATDTGAGSIRAITISQQLTPGLYWLAVCAQGASPATHARIVPFADGGYLNATFNGNVLTNSGVTGAFPSNPTGWAATATNPPVVALRAA